MTSNISLARTRERRKCQAQTAAAAALSSTVRPIATSWGASSENNRLNREDSCTGKKGMAGLDESRPGQAMAARSFDLLTTWEVGTSIVFRNEWNGLVFEQKGTVS